MRQQHRGEKVSLRKGSSIEFSDYREYLKGDDIRSIDWNAYARSERLYLKLFLEEESRPISLIVDRSESMNFGSPSKFEYALSLACCLTYISLNHYDRPEVMLLQNKDFQRYRFGSMKQFFPLMNRLENVIPGGETYLNATLKKLAGAGRPGICFLFSDFYSPDGYDALKLFSVRGNEIHCLQILSPEEIAPDFRGDLKLVDSETSVNAEVSMSPQVLKRYMARLRGLQDSIKKTAAHSFASFSIISTATPLEDLILRDMRRSGLVS
jgi:hypothetical protein